MAKLMDDDESEREKYTSFCAHIAATEMEVWVEEVFAGVDLCRNQPVAWPCVDTDATARSRSTTSNLEGREGSSSVRRLFEVVDCIDQDGSITMQGIVEDRYTEAASIGLYERMDAVFEGMDFDGNGTIEKEELAELIQDDEVSAEIMPLLDNIDEDDTITKEEFRLFFDLMGKGVGETGVEACLITFENLLRLRGNKMSGATSSSARSRCRRRRAARPCPRSRACGPSPRGGGRRAGSRAGARRELAERQVARLHLTPRKDVKPGDKRSSNLPTRDDPTPRELLDSGRLDSSRLNSARGPFKYRGANSGDTLASPQPSGRRRSLSGSRRHPAGEPPATPPDAPGSLKPKPPGSPKQPKGGGARGLHGQPPGSPSASRRRFSASRAQLPKGGVAKNRSPLTSPGAPEPRRVPVGDARSGAAGASGAGSRSSGASPDASPRSFPQRSQSLPTLSIGEASAAALKAALGSARSSVNPTPRSSSTPRTARVTPRRMFSRSNAGSMYTPTRGLAQLGAGHDVEAPQQRGRVGPAGGGLGRGPEERALVRAAPLEEAQRHGAVRVAGAVGRDEGVREARVRAAGVGVERDVDADAAIFEGFDEKEKLRSRRRRLDCLGVGAARVRELPGARARFAAFASTSTQEAGESRYWGRLKPSFACDFPSPVSAVAFAPGEVRGPDGAPVYRVCVAAGLDVHVLSVGARLGSSWDAPRRKSVGRFKAVAQGACWRGDGRLIAVGDAEARCTSSTPRAARRCAGWPRATARARQARAGADNSVCSAGADGTLVLWDVTTGAGVRRVENAHADAATGLAARGDGMVASCGYDGLAKLWDLRQGGARAARTWDHGTRCETIVAVPGATSSRRPAARVALWDGLDDAVLHRFRDAHAKSATCLAVDGARTRLLSGGLDGLVKVHSLADHATVARCGRYAAPVNAIAVAGGDAAGDARLLNRVLCVGTNAGLLDGRARDVSARRDATGGRRSSAAGTVAKRAREAGAAAALRGFRYKDALDEALKTRDPTVVVAVLEELDRRGGRAIALGDRDEKRLEPVLSFAAAHVAHQRYGSRLPARRDDDDAASEAGPPARRVAFVLRSVCGLQPKEIELVSGSTVLLGRDSRADVRLVDAAQGSGKLSFVSRKREDPIYDTAVDGRDDELAKRLEYQAFAYDDPDQVLDVGLCDAGCLALPGGFLG
ncbi:hypothetical protein JL721_7530 [Aureococcus anophagefferens]|nr:hypothetical protein JL721_7530 [Aureococcus anophagefferens]